MAQLHGVTLLSVCLGLAYFANAQIGLECPPISVNDLGSTDQLSMNGLLARSIEAGGESPIVVPARVMSFSLVCDASGQRRGTSSYVSVLVNFQCSSSSVTGCDGTTVLTRQYQYYCNPNLDGTTDFGYDILNANFVQTPQPNATSQTPVATKCFRCIDDVADARSDPVTHCDACSSRCLDKGLGRCYFVAMNGETCCSYYVGNMCVEECPSPLVANNATFNCDCMPLTNPTNGNIVYDNDFAIGSVATYTCNTGYGVQGGPTRTCAADGWNDANITCVRVCPNDLSVDNGRVSYSTPGDAVVGTMATYTCDDGFNLEGKMDRVCQSNGAWSDSPPTCEMCSLLADDPNCESCIIDSTGKKMCTSCKEGTVLGADGKCADQADSGESSSNCSPGCIAGIVLAILGAIIMAVVVALVVYAVYSYLSNPATKLAKAGTEGLNGVARDNPLYLPPEEIVGDVETA